MSAWEEITDKHKTGEWFLIKGGKPGYGWDGNAASTPPAVVARWQADCWQFAHYDSGYYGEWDNPTYCRPLVALLDMAETRTMTATEVFIAEMGFDPRKERP